jgi:glyoxylase-like metal-dependent hydrolase (beta-lactamase superfamily II)
MSSDEYAVEQVTDRVFRIPLPLPLDDLHIVNAYLIDTGSAAGLTLIDPGWATGDNERQLLASLRELGHGPDDITQIAITHGHWDHYSQAIGWQQQYGATVFLGHEERHSIDAFRTLDGVYPAQVGLLRQAGAPAVADAIDVLEHLAHEKDVPFGDPDVWLDDQQVIDLGDRSLVAHLTPGHTRGHMMFEEPTDDVMFTGDHILPRITPSIGFERAPEETPLAAYLDSLQLVVDRPDSRMLPAHGSITDSVHERAHELLSHHEARLKEVGDFARSGVETAHQIASQLRWTRRERHLGDLNLVHQTVAILEVAAHLDVLVLRGVLEGGPRRGVWHYLPSR